MCLPDPAYCVPHSSRDRVRSVDHGHWHWHRFNGQVEIGRSASCPNERSNTRNASTSLGQFDGSFAGKWHKSVRSLKTTGPAKSNEGSATSPSTDEAQHTRC